MDRETGRGQIRSSFRAGPPTTEKITFEAEGAAPSRVLDMVTDFPPGSPGSVPQVAPDPAFVRNLHDRWPHYTVTWQPVLRRHVIWRRASVGWVPVFKCENPFPVKWAGLDPQEAIPLDYRVIAILIDSDPKTYGGQRQQYEHVRRMAKRAEDARKKNEMEWIGELHDRAAQNTKIRTGYGRSPGDRFSRQVSGQVSKEEHVVPLH